MNKVIQEMPNKDLGEHAYITYGVTDDFAWYELSDMSNKLRQLASQFENMERILKKRSEEQSAAYGQLSHKLHVLEQENAKMKEAGRGNI